MVARSAIRSAWRCLTQRGFRLHTALFTAVGLMLGLMAAGSVAAQPSTPLLKGGVDASYIVVGITQFNADTYDVKLKNPRTGYIHSVTIYVDIFISLNLRVGDRVKEHLDKLRADEEENFQLAKKVLDDSYSLFEDAHSLYDWQRRTVQTSGVGHRDHIAAGAVMLCQAQYHLVMGTLDCPRCHVTDSFAHCRGAIEAAAFSARMTRHPHLAMEWLNAGDSDKAYEKYLEKFGGRSIFPKDDAALAELGTRYGICAKQGHPSVYSFASRLRFLTGIGKRIKRSATISK